MERNRTHMDAKVDAIFCADIHLREDTPVCRTDDFWKAQWTKISLIDKLSKFYNCPVLHAGDLFHHWKPSPRLLSYCIEYLPENFYTVYGNHDLPQHNLELIEKSGINTLKVSGAVKILPGCHFGQEPAEPSIVIKGRKILVWHKMIWEDTKPYPGVESFSEGSHLIKKYPEYDCIVSGDNHIPFIVKYKKRLLCNPGSLTRQSAGQIDYAPAVWLYNAQDNNVVPYYLPIKKEDVTRMHLEEVTERNKRLDAFITKLTEKDWEIEMSFESNIRKALMSEDIKPAVKQIIKNVIYN